MLRHHLKLALKVLWRRKMHTAIGLFGITFTLLTLILVAALADHALDFAGSDERHSRILIARGEATDPTTQTSHGFPLGPRLHERFLANLPGAEAISVFLQPERVRAFRDGARVELALKRTDAGFWRIFTFSFIEGTSYDAEDVRGTAPVAVINESTRRRLFDGAPALGRWIELNAKRFRVVGVVRDLSPLRRTPWSDVWVPITTSPRHEPLAEQSDAASAVVLARSPADFPRIRQEANLRASRYDPSGPRLHGRVSVSLETQVETIVNGLNASLLGHRGRDGQTLQTGILLGLAVILVLLFMLLPAVNLINLNVSRVLERSSEIGVRKAFGASSRALVGQFVVENIVLTVIGSGLALLLAAVILHQVNATGLLGAAPLQVSLRVFVVGLLLALVFGLLSGVYPAWKMARLHPLAALRGATR